MAFVELHVDDGVVEQIAAESDAGAIDVDVRVVLCHCGRNRGVIKGNVDALTDSPECKT